MRIYPGIALYLLVFSTLLCTGRVSGQALTMEAAPFFHVTAVTLDEALVTEYRAAINLLTDALEARGGQRNELEGWLFLIGLSKEDASNNVALSIVTMQRLPEQIVQIGKENEAFFLRVSAEERETFEPEGKHIREFVSEEYMRQFADIQGHYVEIVKKSELKEGIEAIVDRFIERHYRWE